MRRKQLGIGLGGLVMGAIILIAVALLGMKLAPSYIEYFAIKKAVNALASGGGSSVAEIRKGFDQRAVVDAIATVKGSDLEITKEGGGLVVRAAYRKEVPLFGNIGLYVDFVAASKD